MDEKPVVGRAVPVVNSQVIAPSAEPAQCAAWEEIVSCQCGIIEKEIDAILILSEKSKVLIEICKGFLEAQKDMVFELEKRIERLECKK